MGAGQDEDALDDGAVIAHSVSGGDYDGVTAASVDVSVNDDETASSGVTLTVAPDAVGEGAGATPITVTATLNGGTRDAATPVAVTVASGTAISGTDFAADTAFTITIPANTGSHTGTFTLTPTPDTMDEPDETVEVNGTSTVAGFAVAGAEVTITDDDAAPTVTLSLSNTSVSEDGGTATVTASLAHASSVPTTVTVSAEAVAPAATLDYSLGSNRILTIAAGSTASTGTVTITGVDNDIDAADKTATVKGGAENTLGVGGPADLTLTIEDDDERGVTVSATTLEMDEGDEATYRVVLTSEPTADVTVTPSRESGDSDVTVSEALTFTALNWSTPQTVTVSAAHDADAEDDEAVIAHAVGGGDYDGATAASVDVTVDDDETASSGVTLTVSPDVVGEGAGATPITVTATLNGGTRDAATPVAVTVASGTAISGTDFAADTAFTITIPANTGSHTGTFTLTPTPDTMDEPDETVEVNGTSTVAGFAVAGAEVTITDDDAAPTVTLSLSNTSVSEDGGTATVTASLAHASSVPTTVTVSAEAVAPAATLDYSLGSNRILTIAAGSTASTGTVTITGVDNDIDAADKTVTVKGGAENTLGVGGPADLTLTIEDDDERGVTVSATTLEMDEGDEATYRVVLTSEPTADVTVTPSRESGDSDVTVSEALTFTALNWSTPQTVTVSAAHDADAEDDEAVIAHAVGGGDYDGATAASVDVTVDDDETASSGVTLTVSPDVVGEGAGATPITVTATLNGGTRDAATPVAVTVASGTAISGTDFAADTAFTITIPANTGSHTGTFTLTPTPDTMDEPDETVEVNGTSTVAGFAVAGAEVTITDDDAAPTVTLSLSNTSVSEDGGTATVTASLAHASSVPTTVTVSAEAVAPAATLDYSLGSNRILTIAAGSTASTGTVTITGVDNDIDAADKTATVKGGAENTLGVGGPADLTLTIEDDDERGVTVSATTLEMDEGDEATYRVVLTSEPTADVTVTPSRESGDSDVTVSEALTFTALNWSTPQTVTVSAAHDADAEDDEAVIAHAVGGGDYDGATAASVDVTVDDDETASSGVTLTVSPDVVGEGAGATTITVTATLDGGTRDSATPVAVSVDSGTATSGTDFTEVESFTITIPANGASHTGTLSLSPTQDTLDEADETVEVNGATTVEDLGVAGAEVTIGDDDSTPTVTLSLSGTSISEAGGIATVTASLDHASSESTAVTVSVAPNTPATSSEYSPSTNLVLTIAADSTASTGTVTITGVDNDIDAADKTVTVKGDAENTLGVGGPADLTLTIVDDDERGVTVSATALEIDEGDAATYTVVLTSEPTSDVTVTPSRESGDADVTVSGALTFTALNWSTPQTMTVSAAEDSDAENDTAVIGNAVGGTDYGSVTAASVDITVDDNESISSEVTLSVSPDAIDEGAGATTITVTATLGDGTRDSETPVAVSVDSGTAASGTDFTEVESFTITIPANGASHTGTFSLSPTQDTLDERDETVSVNGTTTVPGFSVTGAEVEITDDDAAPGVTLSLSGTSISEAGGIATVTASLDHASSESTAVTVSVSPDTPATSSDYSLSTNLVLTIAADSTASTGTVTITGVDNDIDAADKTVKVNGDAENTLGVGDPADLTLTIADDDERGVGVSESELELTEGGNGTFTVVLESEPTADVTVTPSRSAGDTDVTVSGPLTFTSLNWSTAQSVTVSAAQDEDTTGDVATITLQVSGADYEREFVAPVAVTVSDDDDDLAVDTILTLSMDPASVPEGAGQAGSRVTVTATLNHAGYARDLDVTVSMRGGTATETTDFAMVQPRVIRIAAGETQGTATFTIIPVDDRIDEDDESVMVSASVSASHMAVEPASEMALMIEDDDVRGVTVHPTQLTLREHESKEYTVVLESQPTESVIVSISTNGDTDISVTPSQLNFAEEDWSTAQVVTVSRESGPSATVALTHDVMGSGFDTVPVADVRVTLLHSAAEIEAAGLSLAATSRVLLNSVVGVFDGRRRWLEDPYSADENASLAKQIGSQWFGLGQSAGGAGFGATHSRDSAGGMMNAASDFNPGVGVGPGFGFGFGSGSSFGAGFNQRNAAGARSIPGSDPSIQGGGPGGMDDTPRSNPGAGEFDWERRLWGRSFVVRLGLAGDEEGEAQGAGGWTLWGTSDLQSIQGAPSSGRYDGELRSVYLGADRRIGEKWLTGLALSRSMGDVDYQFTDQGGASGGDLGTRLANLYPYVLGQLSEDLDVWAVGGVGRGDAEAKSQRLAETETGDLNMKLVAAGFRLGMARPGAVRLAMIGDAGHASLKVDDGQGVLEGLESSVQRVRLGMEGDVELASVQPFWQLSARYDGGDGQTGKGLDLVAGIRYRAPRVNFEARGRWLLLHSAEGYEEFSATASLTLSANADRSGLMLKLSPRWGQAGRGFPGMGGAMELWGDQSPASAWNRAVNADPGLSFDSEFGYGVLVRRGVLTPTLSVSQNGTPGRMYSLGIGYETLQELVGRQLSLQLALGHNTGRPEDYAYGFRLAYQF